jgi:hypothetical protein
VVDDGAVLANGLRSCLQICQPLEEGDVKWLTGEQPKNKEGYRVPPVPVLKRLTETCDEKGLTIAR